MAGVLMPRKKSAWDSLPVIGTIAGGILGTGGATEKSGSEALGSTVNGAMSGHSYASAGGALMNELSGTNRTNEALAIAGQNGAGAGNAMSRRLTSMQDDPLYSLKKAQMSLTAMDAPTQQEYGPVLDEAYKRALAAKRAGGTVA